MTKCTQNSCNAKPAIIQTGYGKPHPDKYCPICRHPYWTTYDKDGNTVSVEDHVPFAWGAKNWEQLEEWMEEHQYKYYWQRIGD